MRLYGVSSYFISLFRGELQLRKLPDILPISALKEKGAAGRSDGYRSNSATCFLSARDDCFFCSSFHFYARFIQCVLLCIKLKLVNNLKEVALFYLV